MLGLGVLAVSTASATARADEGHHHGPSPGAPLAAGVAECLQAGEHCVQHCIDLLSKGDKAMAPCIQAALDMIAVCTAMQRLAASGGKRLKELAAVCAKTCLDCEAECKKHPKHAVCKACGDACAKTAALALKV